MLHRQRILGVATAAAAGLYLIPFVDRGWIPHDEGMLGQSADRVLHGAIPFIDYEEAYSGGLSWLYALVFRIRGVDLLNVRWLMYGLACAVVWLVYVMARRYLGPIGAAIAAWVALVWSVPNYFAGLPSWWLLLCALASLWAMVRFAETSRRRYLVLAGLSAGLALAVKQTGLYLAIAVVTTITFASGPLLVRWAVAAAAVVSALGLLAPRILHPEGFYLFCPVAACALTLVVPDAPDREPTRRSLLPVVIVVTAMAIPVALLVSPYLVRGRLWDFVNGAVLLPQKRLAFASAPMYATWFALAGVPAMALAWLDLRGLRTRSRAAFTVLWTAAIVLPVAALVNVASYQVIWQSTRAVAAFLPIAICFLLATGRVAQPPQRIVLFACGACLAWLSLNQYPFAAPIYFTYVTPLAVVAAVAVAGRDDADRRDAMLPWAVLLIMFGVLSANRGYIENLGVDHQVRRFDAPLDLPRAHLRVGDGEARAYRALAASIGTHFRGGRLVAGPDCPEVYFLSGLVSPSGALFDFFSESAEEDLTRWTTADVIVVNHEPHFTPRPSEAAMTALRREFAHGEDIGRFEIRWR